jgi:opacity protein-like surface antigen
MKRNVLAVAAALTVAGASAAQAQVGVPMVRPFSFGLSAGASIPTGAFSKETDSNFGANAGFNVTGVLGFRPIVLPVEFRGELMYNRMGVKNVPDGIDASETVLGGSVNVLHAFSRKALVSPYVIGGVGYMQSKGSFSSSGTDVTVKSSGIALNGGAGIRLPLAGLSTFVEARYHYVMSEDKDKGMANATFIPVSFGITF